MPGMAVHVRDGTATICEEVLLSEMDDGEEVGLFQCPENAAVFSKIVVDGETFATWNRHVLQEHCHTIPG